VVRVVRVGVMTVVIFMTLVVVVVKVVLYVSASLESSTCSKLESLEV
jgi:hypothetical protein